MAGNRPTLPRPEHCEVPGCDGKPYRRRRWPKPDGLTWMCAGHHLRLMRDGHPLADVPIRALDAQTCRFPGCDRERYRMPSGRLAPRCEVHRGTWSTSGVRHPNRWDDAETLAELLTRCSFPGCERPVGRHPCGKLSRRCPEHAWMLADPEAAREKMRRAARRRWGLA